MKNMKIEMVEQFQTEEEFKNFWIDFNLDILTNIFLDNL